MSTRQVSIVLCAGLFIATGMALSAEPASGQIKVSAEQEKQGGAAPDDSIQLKVDKVICRDPFGNATPCKLGDNPATGRVECEKPPLPPASAAITCVKIALIGTSIFYSGPNGCHGLGEAQWDVGITPGTQRVFGLGMRGGNMTTCERAGVDPLPFRFGTGDTIKSEVKQ